MNSRVVTTSPVARLLHSLCSCCGRSVYVAFLNIHQCTSHQSNSLPLKRQKDEPNWQVCHMLHLKISIEVVQCAHSHPCIHVVDSPSASMHPRSCSQVCCTMEVRDTVRLSCQSLLASSLAPSIANLRHVLRLLFEHSNLKVPPQLSFNALSGAILCHGPAPPRPQLY